MRTKIQNLKFKIQNSELGFTLVELLIVLSVFSIMLLVINQILFATFRGAAKTEVTDKVKREGERVMAVIERSIRNAQTITACSTTQVTYLDQYGAPGSFSCVNIGSGSGVIASGSGNLTGTDVDVTSCSISCENVGGIPKAVLVTASFAGKSSLTAARIEESGSVTLQSRIILRN